jgi:hypothetical protein
VYRSQLSILLYVSLLGQGLQMENAHRWNCCVFLRWYTLINAIVREIGY